MTDKNDALESFASVALRRSRPGSYEQLLCQHLIAATVAPPIEKIRLVCEAAYMVPEPPVDAETLETIYKVVTSFTSTQINIHNISDDYHWPGQVAWAFTTDEENYEKMIKPWLPNLNRVYWSSRNPPFEENDPPHIKFWGITQHAHVSTLESLKARFTVWAMPATMAMFEALSKLVNPDTYMDMLERVKK